jgi:hypothetical protein
MKKQSTPDPKTSPFFLQCSSNIAELALCQLERKKYSNVISRAMKGRFGVKRQ